VFVHKDNPLSRLTLQQLDGIFGAQRSGGWQGMEWSTDIARSDKDDIRTWGQLGLTGEWADQPIHPYGPPGLYPGGMSFFQIKVMGGADSWAERLQEFADCKQMMDVMSKDRYAIAYTAMNYRTSAVKAVALAERQGGPYVESSRENVANGSYPLARSIYVYLPPDAPNGDPLVPQVDPKVKEFLRYILSRQGQQDVVREGDFLPLTANTLGEQLPKLDESPARGRGEP
jgi:phosphate transport system substrate-binding protein